MPAFSWRETLSSAAYSALVWLLQPLLRRKLRKRGHAEPGYLLDVGQRFGTYSPDLLAELARRGEAGPRVWLHAVSLGETRVAALVAAALRERWPGMQLVLTSSTATGREEGRKFVRDGDIQLWLPWDTRAAVGRFVAAVRPDIGLVMETEVWPNLMRALRCAGIPTLLLNARLNEKSARGALRWPALMAPAYGAFAQVLAQTDADAARLRRVGAVRVQVRGNIKYDARPDRAQMAMGRAWRARALRPVALLASSREGEELAWLDALEHLARSQGNASAGPPLAARPSSGGGLDAALAWGRSDVQWLVVPRHPQRFDAVARMAASRGWAVVRRSQWGPSGPPAEGQAPRTLWLGDSMGEMAAYYSLAQVALLGGSFEPLGGQNLIEAAACGCPVLMGPHTFNFEQACEQAAAAGAARRVATLAQAVEAARDLLGPGRSSLDAMHQAAFDFVAASRGALQATVADVAACLGRHQR